MVFWRVLCERKTEEGREGEAAGGKKKVERRAWRCTCLLLPGVTEFTSAVLQGEQVAGEGGGLGTRFEGCRNRSRMSKKI